MKKKVSILFKKLALPTLRFIYFRMIGFLTRKTNPNKQKIFIVALKNRLGNQMFQHSLAVALKAHYPNTQVKLDISQMGYSVLDRLMFKLQKRKKNTHILPQIFKNAETIPNTLASILTEIFIAVVRNFFSTQIVHDSLTYKNVFLPFNQSVYFDGYWQSEKYFKKYKKNILEYFLFPPFQEKENIKLSKEIQSSSAISIHVRRGDYILTHKKIYGNICTMEYYTKAIRHIKKEVFNPKFIFFSDDIAWCKETFGEKKDSVFVDWNVGDNSFRDMQLMSLCKHNIIANSSFSWWGAWLNNNMNKIVIAPKKWFNDNTISYHIDDIIPQEWIKIKV